MRTHAIIAEIEKSKQIDNFFQRCTGALGPLKDFLLGQAKLKLSENGEHGYAFHPTAMEDDNPIVILLSFSLVVFWRSTKWD